MLLLLVLVCCCVQQSSSAQQNSETTAKLISECVESTGSTLARIFDYAYTHTSTFRRRNQNSQIQSEDVRAFEAYPVRGHKFVYILVNKDGKPIAADKVERERRRAIDELAQVEERQTNVTSTTEPSEQDRRYFGIWYNRGDKKFSLIPTDFLRTHEFYAPRRTTFNNREAILLSFRPRPAGTALDMSGRLRTYLGGRVWIDAVDKVLMRLEAVPMTELKDDTSAALSPNAQAPVQFELTRLPNGTWVPSLGSLNTYGRQIAFEDVSFDFSYRCDNFRLFSTSVDKVDIKAPQP